MRLIIYSSLLLLSACRGPQAVVSRPAIPVSANVRLAADVVLPATMPVGGRVPTILIQTRYWRSFRMRGGGGPAIPQGPREAIVARLVRAGFAVVITDVRGTGASDGVWRWPWSHDEVHDTRVVLDWIVAQPWSNGAVGATGVSYEGTMALLAASLAHPSLKAVLARQVEWQLVDETLAPDGVRNALFSSVWGDAVDALDHGRYPDMFPRLGKLLITGVARRDEDPRGVAQQAREAARARSDVAERAQRVRTGRDRFGVDAPPTDSLGPAGHAAALAQTRAVVAIWGSWWDGATADAVFRAESAMPIAQAVIGGWTHDGDRNASPLRRRHSAQPTVHLDSVVAFFTRTVRETPPVPDATQRETPVASHGRQREMSPFPDSTQRVRWYVAGSERWRSAARWPRTVDRSWMLVDSSIAAPHDSMLAWRSTVRASTGRNNRWTTGLVRPVDAANRAKARGLHSVLLPTLTEPLRVFGAGTFTCAIASDQREATLHVYVESVDAAGRVRLLSEGMQRVTGDSTGPSRAGAPLRPVSIRIRPVAFELPAGWRLRMSLASEDEPTFERVPAAGDVAWRLDTRACTLTLPEERAALTGGSA